MQLQIRPRCARRGTRYSEPEDATRRGFASNIENQYLFPISHGLAEPCSRPSRISIPDIQGGMGIT
jgi:hypothetical protein